ncbi:MAG: hypothetical protein IPN76_14060 [Saprospiraceae bacterium]|nr:hypothetical protein [Saprospiraceae bacterium]
MSNSLQITVKLVLLCCLSWCGQASAQSCGMVVHDAKTGLGGSNFLSIFQDSKGLLWVGTYGYGLRRYDGKRWESWSQSEGFFNNNVSDIFEDKEGGIWLDHSTHGVSRWKDGKVQSFDFAQDTISKGKLFYDQKKGAVTIVEGFQFEGVAAARIFEFDYKKRRFIDTKEKVVINGIPKGYSHLHATRGQNNEWWANVNYSAKRKLEFYQIKNGNAQILKVPSSDYMDELRN